MNLGQAAFFLVIFAIVGVALPFGIYKDNERRKEDWRQMQRFERECIEKRGEFVESRYNGSFCRYPDGRYVFFGK